MIRHSITPRNQWQKAVEKLGFGFHTADVPYWDESCCYSFSMDEIDTLERATATLWDMCLVAVQHVIDNKLYDKLHIPAHIVPLIESTWENDAPSIYGRFDFCYNGKGEPVLLEFNADTPTSLFEAGIVQWFWLQDFSPNRDQFNSIHEKLIEYWRTVRLYLNDGPLYFACLRDNLEDLTTTEYIRDCAIQGNLSTEFIFIEDIGWDSERNTFVDLENRPIKNIFKLYPYEWMVHEEFGRNLMLDSCKAHWIEPAWKMILSNKGILPILWQLFPNHPNLLPAYFDKHGMVSYVRKPLLSREGANVTIVENDVTIATSEGEYGEEGYIYQQLKRLPNFEKNYPVVGSWIVGQYPCGIGIREANTLITGNLSRFIPHFIE